MSAIPQSLATGNRVPPRTVAGAALSPATQASTYNWSAIAADPDFVALHREKTLFLASLMAISVIAYFLLPIGAAYFPEVFKIKVWGPMNVGLIVALAEFVIAWGIAFVYSRRANRRFDALTRALVERAQTIGARS